MSSKGQQLGKLAPERELSFAKGRGIERFRVAASRIHRVRDGRRGPAASPMAVIELTPASAHSARFAFKSDISAAFIRAGRN